MARTLLLVVCLLGLLAGSFGQVLQYYKEFTVVPPGGAPTVCGPVANIDILAGVADPLQGWTTVCNAAAPPVTVSRFARIIGFGITAKASVPSGQWNFLSASITSANGLSEQLFPKGGFTSACGKVTPITGSDSQINFEVFEPDFCPNGPDGPASQTTAETGFGKFDNTADPLAAKIPLNNDKYIPFPRNRFSATNLTPRWVNVPFFPDGTLNAQTKLGTVSFNTGLVQFPFCWSSVKLRVWVSNCPSNTLASDYPETPALVTSEQPVAPNPNPATDTFYRGSSATWRQLTPLSHTTDRVQVDFITAWKKTYTNFLDADLKALRVDVFVEPITLGSVPIISTNFLDFDTTITPSANRIGTQWGGLGAVAAATAGERDRQFLMDDLFGYNVYVRSMVFTIPGRASIEAPRTVRIVLSGCCRPGALFKINGAGTPPVPVSSGVDLSFDTTIVARLEHPSSTTFPRSSPELYVPPIQFLSGSETPMAAPDTVAFGGFVKGAVNGAAETASYAFTVSEISPAAPSLQEVSSTFEPVADPTSVVVKAKFLRPTSFQPGLFVAPPPLSGTTARGTLTQTSTIGGQQVVVSSVTHDFLVFRRQIEITNSVNEMQYCNFLRDTGGTLITPTKAYQTGTPATVAFTTVGLTGPTPSIEHKYSFPQDKQCGNQIGVRPLRATATVFQRGADCPTPNTCALQTDVTGTRTPGTAYPALWFLYNDGSSAIAPVYTTRAPAAYVPQALYGLDILAVASVGFPVRTVDGVSTALSRERLGITYCYSRAYVTCTTSPTFTVVATGGNCVSPAGDTVAACPTNVGQLGKAVVTLNPGHGNGAFVFLFTAKASDGTISTLGSQTVSFTGAQQVLTYNSPSPIASGSTVSYAITDPAQCTYRGALVIAPTSVPPAGAVSSIRVASITQPTCTVAGSATISFVYQAFAGNPAVTLTTAAGGAGADFVGGAAPAPVAVTVTPAGGPNTWSFTTASVVRGGTVIYSFVLPVQGGGTITYQASATFTSLGPALTGTVSINAQFVATVTAGAGVPPYTYAFTVAGAPRTAIAGTPNSIQLSTATDAGATLGFTVTDSKGCTFVGTQALPGGAAGGQMTITVTGVTAPTSADAAAVVSFSATATTNLYVAGNSFRVGLMYCLAGTPTTCNTWSTVSNVALNPIITSFPPLPGTSTVVFRLRIRRLVNNVVTSVPDAFSALTTYTIPATPTPPFYFPPDIVQNPVTVTQIP